MRVLVYAPLCMFRGQRLAVKSQFSPSTFSWVPRIELKSPGFCGKCLPTETILLMHIIKNTILLTVFTVLQITLPPGALYAQANILHWATSSALVHFQGLVRNGWWDMSWGLEDGGAIYDLSNVSFCSEDFTDPSDSIRAIFSLYGRGDSPVRLGGDSLRSGSQYLS